VAKADVPGLAWEKQQRGQWCGLCRRGSGTGGLAQVQVAVHQERADVAGDALERVRDGAPLDQGRRAAGRLLCRPTAAAAGGHGRKRQVRLRAVSYWDCAGGGGGRAAGARGRPERDVAAGRAGGPARG